MDLGTNGDSRARDLSLGDVARLRLHALCEALEWPDPATAEQTLALLTQCFRQQPLTFAPRWATDLTDDGSPFEFSVACGEELELRMLTEAQSWPFDIRSNWESAGRVNADLATRPGTSLQRFNAIATLFEPHAASRASFAIWHAARLLPNAEPAFKVYLNPQIHGAEQAPELIMEALRALQMNDAAQYIASRIEPSGERFMYLSLDLSANESARVKVYIAHAAMSRARLEALFEGTRDYRPGSVARWLEAIIREAVLLDDQERPLLSCVAFNGSARPQVTLHMPVRCHAPDDEQALQRALGLLSATPAERLERAIRRWATRPLAAGRGMITYVSCRDEAAGTRVTTYLAPQLFAINAPRTAATAPPLHSDIRELRTPADPQPTLPTMAAVRESIERHRQTLAQHPFIERLDAPGSFEAMRTMAPQLTFFVLAFQDMLRLARTHAGDGPLAEMARAHEAEDRGHEQWFLNDLDVLEVSRDLRWVFSPAHATTRDVSYALVAEVLRATDDRSRLAVLLALEAAGAEFFGRAIAYLERLDRTANLMYFARQHQHVEQNHSVFEAEEQRRLWASTLPNEVYAEVLGAVDRTFAGMARLATALNATMSGAGPTQEAS